MEVLRIPVMIREDGELSPDHLEMVVKRDTYSPWAGKRSYSPWTGKKKRSSSNQENVDEPKPKKFLPWAGKRSGMK